MRITLLETNDFDFPPFQGLKLDFRETKSKGKLAEVQALTGINGTGKTRLLCLLAAYLGNSVPMQSRLGRMPVVSAFVAPWGDNSNLLRFAVDLHFGRGIILQDGGFTDMSGSNSSPVPALAYSGAAYVVDSPISVMAKVPQPSRAEQLSFQKTSEHSKTLFQQLANIIMQGALDEQKGKGNSASNRLRQAIESSIREVTSHEFSLELQTLPEPAITVNWRNLPDPIKVELLPDGLRSLIGWMVDAAVKLSQLLPDSSDPLAEPCILLLDEPETHLHPEWQRLVLPVAQRLFKNAQIFVATHSPFILSSLNEGWIHKLVLRNDGTVYAEPPMEAKQGDSFIDAAEDVLGMGPAKWYDPESAKMLTEFRSLRESALSGDRQALHAVEALGAQIGERGPALANLVGAELSQLRRIMQKKESA